MGNKSAKSKHKMMVELWRYSLNLGDITSANVKLSSPKVLGIDAHYKISEDLRGSREILRVIGVIHPKFLASLDFPKNFQPR